MTKLCINCDYYGKWNGKNECHHPKVACTSASLIDGESTYYPSCELARAMWPFGKCGRKAKLFTEKSTG